jgi:hypothetical protein
LFKLQQQPEAEAVIARTLAEVAAHKTSLQQQGLAPVPGQPAKNLTTLKAEMERLNSLLGLDQANAKKKQDLERALGELKKTEALWVTALDNATKAPERRKAAAAERLARYEKVFESLLKEETALKELYKGLQSIITGDPRLRKLSISVHRTVDVQSWVNRGNDLLDLRKMPFGPRVELEAVVRSELLPAWQAGKAADIRAAVEAFIGKHANNAVAALLDPGSQVPLGEWIFSTDHISIEYGITHEGVDLGKHRTRWLTFPQGPNSSLVPSLFQRDFSSTSGFERL